MTRAILIIGGYGEVGKVTAQYLSRFYPGKVIVAGRRLEQAQAMAASTNGAVRAMQLDMNNLPDPDEYLDGVETVCTVAKTGYRSSANSGAGGYSRYCTSGCIPERSTYCIG